VPLPIIANVYRVAVRTRLEDVEDCINVTHWLDANPPSTALALAELIRDEWTAFLTAYASQDLTGVDVTATPLDGSATAATVVMEATGNGGVTTVSHQCALVLSHQTAKRGRSFRGRTYLPGVPVSTLESTDHSKWTATKADGTAAQYDTLVAELLANEWNFVVASYTNETAEIVTNTIGRRDVFTQRRRVK